MMVLILVTEMVMVVLTVDGDGGDSRGGGDSGSDGYDGVPKPPLTFIKQAIGKCFLRGKTRNTQ